MTSSRAVLVAVLALAGLAHPGGQTPARHNVIIFVADGLRHGSVTAEDTPALWSVRQNGVHFEDSYSLFPTFTMANASAIATGHMLGDTGNYGNVLWTGAATFDTGNFGLMPDTPVPFIENDRIVADLADHYGGNYLGAETFLGLARAAGYQTAAVGKLGPVALQDLASVTTADRKFPPLAAGIIVDDATGSAAGPPLAPAIVERLSAAGLALDAPTRSNGYDASSHYNNGFAGDRASAGTLAANVVQQQWFADVTTRAVLPQFLAKPDAPFVLLYWSRDPDGSQHNNGDSFGQLAPGINGPTSKRGAQNADRNLQQILEWLDAHPAVKAVTDVFVTSDHGFSTVNRTVIDRERHPTTSESAKHDYRDTAGKIDTVRGTLPAGFLAIDLATSMALNLFDPERRASIDGPFHRVDLDPASASWEHPVRGGLIGTSVRKNDGSDARLIVAANGGTDFIYLPSPDAALAHRVVDLLFTYDYVGAVFVDDGVGVIPGTLPLSAVSLVGGGKLPRPAIVVAFRAFTLESDDVRTAVEISDATQQQGQGMHGSFGRADTFNNMAAIGPDFKARFADSAPMSNADIVPTLARAIGLPLPAKGRLAGRVAVEALAGGPAASAAPLAYLRSTPANGKQTIVLYREHDGRRYVQEACLVETTAANRANICR